MTLGDKIQNFNQKRIKLLDELETLDPAVLTTRPQADKWSILEIIEHLVVAERAVLSGLFESSRQRQSQRSLKNHLMYIAVMAVLKLPFPVKVPAPSMLPQGNKNLDDLRKMWDENLKSLQSYLSKLDQQSIQEDVFRHPIAGPMTVSQAVHMDFYHFDRHLRQIRRLQRQFADDPSMETA